MIKPVVGPANENFKEFIRCWPWLEASLEGLTRPNGTVWLPHNKSTIWWRIEQGRAYLWPGEQSVFLTEFYQSPTGLKTHHMWLAGGDLNEIVSMVPTLEDFGRLHGAHRQTGSGRRGWLRKFSGYTEVGVRKQKSLMV